MYQRTWSDGRSRSVLHRRWPIGKPRVLVEDASDLAAVSDHSMLREAGFEVAVCSGPDGSAGCPLVEGGRCELAESADVVLFGLDVDDVAGRAVLHAHLRRRPELPVVVALRREPEVVLADDAIASCQVLPPAASVGGQVRELRRALPVGRES
jgi:hypothetical protein